MQNRCACFCCLCFFSVFFACQPKETKETSHKAATEKKIVKGIIEKFDRNGMVFLYKIRNGVEVLADTVSVQPSGRFYVEFFTDRPEICVLEVYGERHTFVAVNPVSKLEVKNAGKIPEWQVINSPENEAFQSYKKLHLWVAEQRKRLTNQKDKEKFEQKINKEIRKFYQTKNNFFAALLSLQLLDNQQDTSFLHTQLRRQKKRFGNTDIWVRLHQKTKPFAGLAQGAVAPNFLLPNQKDSLVELHSFLGKKVLLNFWASWCLKCPEVKNTLIRRQQEKFTEKDSVFLIHISFDTNKGEWIGKLPQSTQPYQIELIEQGSWQSELAKIYAVESLPLLCFIDSQGKILRYDMGWEAF